MPMENSVQYRTKGEIRSLEEMTAYLAELAENANESLEAALKAQLEVIRYVQSPSLYDSSFDLFFKNVKNALKYAESQWAQDKIREQATIMIQNYVFFMNAKLQYEIEVDREEQRALLEESCGMLVNSVVAIATAATKSKSDVPRIILTELTRQNQQGDSIFTKVYRWWTKESRTRQKQGEFLETMDLLIAKLYKQRAVIGQSNLIAGLIARYAEAMANYFYGEDIARGQRLAESLMPKVKRKITIWLIVIVVVNIIALVGRWGYLETMAWMNNESADTSHWALAQWGYALGIWGLIAILIYVKGLLNKKRVQQYVNEMQAKWEEAYLNYQNMATAFEE